MFILKIGATWAISNSYFRKIYKRCDFDPLRAYFLTVWTTLELALTDMHFFQIVFSTKKSNLYPKPVQHGLSQSHILEKIAQDGDFCPLRAYFPYILKNLRKFFGPESTLIDR